MEAAALVTIAGAVDMVMDALATADPQAAVDMRARIAGLAARSNFYKRL